MTEVPGDDGPTGYERHEDFRLSLGAYLEGALDPDEEARVTGHLDQCAECRAELAQLKPLAAVLGALSVENFMVEAEMPPPSVLPAILDRMRAERERDGRRLWAWRSMAGASIAAAVVAVAAWAGFFHSSGQAGLQLQAASGNGAAGHVVLVAKPWGTAIELAMTGLPSSTNCIVYAVDTGGSRQLAGAWGPTPNRSAMVDVATSIPRGQLSRIVVVTPGGKAVLSVAV